LLDLERVSEVGQHAAEGESEAVMPRRKPKKRPSTKLGRSPTGRYDDDQLSSPSSWVEL